MKQTVFTILSISCVLAVSRVTLAQQKNRYNRHAVFDQTFFNQPGNAYRSGDGAPGPMYWQNRADYDISAKLDTHNKSISATDIITYTNYSPDNLHYVWLQVEENLYNKDSRGTIIAPTDGYRYIIPGFSGGYNFESVTIRLNGKMYKADYLVNDTRMQIRLPGVLRAHGGKLIIHIRYNYEIPPFRNRTGYSKTKNGMLFNIAQWYPRMAVYDDVRGWNNLPYLGRGQFYTDYGDFSYHINVPWNYIVVGSGDLQNPQQVLTKEEIRRIDEARKSDKTVMIIRKDELNKAKMRPVHSGRLTWNYKINNARGAVWAASDAFIWDAARINLPGGKKALAESAYPVEAAGDSAWGRSTQFVKGTIEYDSKQWYPYPWPVAINIAAKAGGMEYPGVTFIGMDGKVPGLWNVITHEMGHSWFPMIVGSDERRYGFMDEGFNTFIDIYSTLNYNNDEFGHYSMYTKSPASFGARMYSVAGKIPPIMTRPDAEKNRYVGMNSYVKPALGLWMLREYVLGHKRFDYAFRTYIRRWAYKHPKPIDFFRTMNDAAGEDLNWFWKEWFYKTWLLDQAVDDVKYINNSPDNGVIITISNNDRMVMPVTVKIVESDRHSEIVHLPVEIWQRGGKWSFKYNSTSRIDSVIIDPNHMLPDVNQRNNIWTPGVNLR